MPNPRRGQLDRQRDAVQALADLQDGRGVGRGECKARRGRGCPLDEQPDGFVLGQRLRAEADGADIGQGQGRHAEGHFAGDPQRFAAGGQDGQLRAGLQQRICQAGAGLDHVLAVVQDQQQLLLSRDIPAAASIAWGPVSSRRPRARAVTVGHQGRVGQRGQLHQPDAVSELLHQPGRGLQRQAGLAGAARAGQRHQAVGLQQMRDGSDLLLTPNKGG